MGGYPIGRAVLRPGPLLSRLWYQLIQEGRALSQGVNPRNRLARPLRATTLVLWFTYALGRSPHT